MQSSKNTNSLMGATYKYTVLFVKLTEFYKSSLSKRQKYDK